jgi:ATP-binding cassette subfamily B multidrug efflux pump
LPSHWRQLHERSEAFLNKYFVKYRLAVVCWVFLFVTVIQLLPGITATDDSGGPGSCDENLGLVHVIGDVGNRELFSQIGLILLLFGGFVLVLALLMGLFMYIMRQTIIVMSRLIEYDMRKEIFAHYERLSQAFYKRNNTGDLMSRITEDVKKSACI